jgi:glycosyltransferase involved in cell wall biosynthesis
VRVLQVDAGREWRGGQNQVRLLTRELAREPSLDLLLVTKRGGTLARRAASEGVAVRGVPWSLSVDPRAWWAIRSLVRTLRPDVVHVHDSHSLSLSRSASPGAILIAHRRVDFHIRPGSNWFKADRIVAVSEAVRRVLSHDGLRPESIAVIPDGIDPAEIRANAIHRLDIRSRLGLPPTTPLAVNVAALVDHKDQRTLIRAAAEARARRPDLHWAIAGEGELRHRLEREIAQAGLGDRVHLLGYITEVDALIWEADVFVMSSKEEGLGSVILHALALGKPVAATGAGGIPEVLPPEMLVPVGDAAALASRVVASLERPFATSLPPQFTAKSMAQATLALYHSLV